MKRKHEFFMNGYTATIQDYKYTSRPPVSVRVSGTIEGECKNTLGEPCFFYKCSDAMSMKEGIEIAKNIIRARV